MGRKYQNNRTDPKYSAWWVKSYCTMNDHIMVTNYKFSEWKWEGFIDMKIMKVYSLTSLTTSFFLEGHPLS